MLKHLAYKRFAFEISPRRKASFIEIYGLFDLSIFQISTAADAGETENEKLFHASWATAMIR
jgi:hypothetical protein